MAERAGFEPAVRVIPVRRFSKPVLSTTQPSLRARSRPSNQLGFGGLSKENFVPSTAFLYLVAGVKFSGVFGLRIQLPDSLSIAFELKASE